MRRFYFLLCAAFLSTAAHAATPSDASIDDLLASMKVEKTMQAMFPSIDKVMKQSMTMAAQGQKLSAKQQQFFDATIPKVTQIMRDELSWDKMRPLYVEIYRDSFSQEEVDGLVAFYKSPVGAAYIEKMPVVMQKTMGLMQTRMGPMMAKMQAAIRQAAEDAKNSK
jgi:hypothetical protein